MPIILGIVGCYYICVASFLYLRSVLGWNIVSFHLWTRLVVYFVAVVILFVESQSLK